MNKRDETETAPLQDPHAAQILVVDDETSIFDVFAMMFPTPRHVLAVAANGNQAVQLVSARPFDVAFVDCFLGNENGIEVAQNLRKVQPDLDVVLMSGYLRDENSSATEEAGARAFLTKPFSFETAQAVVARLLGRKRKTQAKPAPEAS